MTTTKKMTRAREALDRLQGTSWERAQLAGAKNEPACRARLDRLEATASAISEKDILDIPGFTRVLKRFLRRKNPKDFLPYKRMSKFTSGGSIREMNVYTGRRMERMAHCKVTMIARDETGLLPKDMFSVLELLPGVRLVTVELAFDFGFESGVDGEFVRQHGLFGKSRRNQFASRRCYDTSGSRKGAKFVRSYFKKELGIHRVELQLTRKGLRQNEINDVFDFHRFVSALPSRHILFARLDKKLVRQGLRNQGHSPRERDRIMERVKDAKGDLYDQLAVLRKKGGLTNIRRLLVRMPANYLVVSALKEWVRQWPKKPTRLGRK